MKVKDICTVAASSKYGRRDIMVPLKHLQAFYRAVESHPIGDMMYVGTRHPDHFLAAEMTVRGWRLLSETSIDAEQ